MKRNFPQRPFWAGLGLAGLLALGPVPGMVQAQDSSAPGGGTATSEALPPGGPTDASAQATAETAQSLPDDPTQSPGAESDQVELLTSQNQFRPGTPGKDPFKPLVTKPKRPDFIIATQTPIIATSTPPEIKISPLRLLVTGICGNEGERLAMIVFENKPYVIAKEMVVDGKFKVVDIFPDRVTVYSFKEQSRRTFPIGGGKE